MYEQDDNHGVWDMKSRRGLSAISIAIITSALLIAAFIAGMYMQERATAYIKSSKTTVRVSEVIVYPLTQDPLPQAVAVKFLITNMGNVKVSVAQVEVDTSGGPDFSYVATLTVPITVNPGETVQVSVIAEAPTATGIYLPDDTIVRVYYTSPDGNGVAVAPATVIPP